MALLMQNASFQLAKNQLQIEQLYLKDNDFWVVVGGNASGKSALAQALAGKIALTSGQFSTDFCKIVISSFEQQQKIIEKVFNDRNNDSVNPDDFGITVREMILNGCENQQLCEQYATKLQISALLDRPFIQLSTGESRKVLLCQLLVTQPDLLILDEAFEGLDQASIKAWLALLAELNQQMTIVLILSRLNDVPSFATHLALLDQLSLIMQGQKTEVENNSLYQQLIYAENALSVPLPESVVPPIHLPENQNTFELKNVTVQYGEQKILNNLSWTVQPKQHWWIKGPNGAGKSTLLSLITGDHPQSYANHVVLFGKQRGSGETVWDIKKNIGYVSTQLHMDYRVNSSVRDVIISGFFDSVGIYQHIPEALKLKANEWLIRLNLHHLATKPFRTLSWGQQRLLLITRAMVKHPPILILDEPLQGLDGLNRKLVKHFIDQLVQNSQTQLLFVSHQDQDVPDCITHLFEFIPCEQGYYYQQTEK